MKFDGIIENFQNKRKMRKALVALEDAGFCIEMVYDIGANKGRWTRDMSKVLPNSKFVMFEANESHRKYLVKRKFPFFIEVLSKSEEEAKFFSIGGTGDSLYLEKTIHYSDNDYKIVKTRTLDSLAAANGLKKPNFIKLDVQGAELDILEGAQKTLGECYLIYMECPVTEYNINAPSFDDYIKFMNGINFVPLQILEQHLIDSELVQFDILFIKRDVKDRIIGKSNRNNWCACKI